MIINIIYAGRYLPDKTYVKGLKLDWRRYVIDNKYITDKCVLLPKIYIAKVSKFDVNNGIQSILFDVKFHLSINVLQFCIFN